MPKPTCPTELRLRALITFYLSIRDNEDARDTANALEYLDNMLTNRRGYQRKMQIRRKVLTQFAREQGWDQEIDDAVKAQFGDDIEKMSLDDTEEDDDAV
jgi:hypothetical protein